jgi:hypothetical protein
MADVSISGLSEGIPSKNSAVIPYSDGSNTYRTSPSGIVAASPGAVLQVTSAIKTDISSTASTSFIDIPGLSASITPKSVSSKILFTGNVFGSCANNAFVRIMRSIGGAAYSQVYTSTSTVGNRTPVSFGDFYMSGGPGTGAGRQNTSIFLDTTTNTTSEIIYKLQYKAILANYPFAINSTYYDADAYYQAIGASSITLMEIAG